MIQQINTIHLTQSQVNSLPTSKTTLWALLMQLTSGEIEKLVEGSIAEAYKSPEVYITLLEADLPKWEKVVILNRIDIDDKTIMLLLDTGYKVVLKEITYESYEVDEDYGIGQSLIAYGISINK